MTGRVDLSLISDVLNKSKALTMIRANELNRAANQVSDEMKKAGASPNEPATQLTQAKQTKNNYLKPKLTQTKRISPNQHPGFSL